MAKSAGRSGRPRAPAPERGARRLRRPRAPRVDPTTVIAIVVLALALPALTTWIVGRLYRTSETDRVDARLSSSLRIAADSVAAIEVQATRSARALAESRAVQSALARHDVAALALLGHRGGVVSLRVRTPGPAPPASAGTVVRTVVIRGPTRIVGAVDAVEHVGPLLRRISLRTRTVLQLASPPGATGQPYDVTRNGTRYRGLHVRSTAGIDLLALVPRHEIDAAVHHRQLLTFAAAALTAAALGLLALLVVPGGWGVGTLGRRRAQRSAVALFGDVIAAAHDPQLLLPVILETTVVATGAVGGAVVWDGATVAEIPAEASPSAERLTLSLDDEVSGRLLVLQAPRAGFTVADRELAHSLAGQGRIALDNARLHGVVRHQAVTDDLTDLANRRRFMDALRQEVARSARLGTALALVLFDLDHFKQINDRCGHQAGDDVLRATADVIRARVRETDLAARIGGEEFALILPGTDRQGAVSLADHLRRDLSQNVAVPADDLTLTASFGVAEHDPGELAEALIGSADRALYRAKAEGRNRVNVATADADPSEGRGIIG